MKRQDFRPDASFFAGMKAQDVRDALNAAFRVPRSRRKEENHALGIRLGRLAASVSPHQPARTDEGRLEASHLCHNITCFSPEHLVMELHAVNLARNACRKRFNAEERLGCSHGDPSIHRPSCILQWYDTVYSTKRKITGGVAEMKKKMEAEHRRSAESSQGSWILF